MTIKNRLGQLSKNFRAPEIYLGLAVIILVIITPKVILYKFSDPLKPWIGTMIALSIFYLSFYISFLTYFISTKTYIVNWRTTKREKNKTYTVIRIILIILMLITAYGSLKWFTIDLINYIQTENLRIFNGTVDKNNLTYRDRVLMSQTIGINNFQTGEKEFYTSYFLPEIQEHKEYTFYILPHSELIVWFEAN